MGNRYDFKCWNCSRSYSLYREITTEQELIVACPYCNIEGVVRLIPYRRKPKVVLRGEESQAETVGYEYAFPKVIPTEKPD